MENGVVLCCSYECDEDVNNFCDVSPCKEKHYTHLSVVANAGKNFGRIGGGGGLKLK